MKPYILRPTGAKSDFSDALPVRPRIPIHEIPGVDDSSAIMNKLNRLPSSRLHGRNSYMAQEISIDSQMRTALG